MSYPRVKQVFSSLMALVLMTSAAGCVSYPERQDFGEAVRHMQATQTALPGMPVEPHDGERARAILDVHRGDIAAPKDVTSDIVINIGSGNQ